MYQYLIEVVPLSALLPRLNDLGANDQRLVAVIPEGDVYRIIAEKQVPGGVGYCDQCGRAG